VTGSIDEELRLRNEYLITENLIVNSLQHPAEGATGAPLVL